MSWKDLESYIIEREMDFFVTYLNDMEQQLSKKTIDLEKEWDSLEKEKDRSYDHEEYLIERNEELDRHVEIFYSSFIITIFTFLENKLNEKCDTYSRKLKINVRDMRGSGINRAILFLEKILGFSLPDQKLYEELKILNEVRNCLAHSGGEITGKNEKLLSYFKSSTTITFYEYTHKKTKKIKISKQYCELTTKLIRNYLYELIERNRDK